MNINHTLIEIYTKFASSSMKHKQFMSLQAGNPGKRGSRVVLKSWEEDFLKPPNPRLKPYRCE